MWPFVRRRRTPPAKTPLTRDVAYASDNQATGEESPVQSNESDHAGSRTRSASNRGSRRADGKYRLIREDSRLFWAVIPALLSIAVAVVGAEVALVASEKPILKDDLDRFRGQRDGAARRP
jgi:hypothetical protein